MAAAQCVEESKNPQDSQRVRHSGRGGNELLASLPRASNKLEDRRIPKNHGKRLSKKKVKKQDHDINDEPLSDGGSLDPRERLMGMKSKRGGVRPVSNQLDRFGRIAFNKNKEPS